MTQSLKKIPLFFDGYDLHAREGVGGRFFSLGHSFLRTQSRKLRKLQPNTGFYTAFCNLAKSLRYKGYEVVINDFAFARANPTYPVGLSGFASVYEAVRLENPALFGPGYVPPPEEAPSVVEACNLEIVTLPSKWPCEIWRTTLGSKVEPMFVGIDTEHWPDLSQFEKTLDVLIYDKIRWHRDLRVPEIRDPLIDHLNSRNLRYSILRYGHHNLTQFRKDLKRARAFVFLCEHETQGLAYQEAMASGVPIFAWDEGELVDPIEKAFAPLSLEVSSVPYFDDRCGMRFKASNMLGAFDCFFEQHQIFKPRDYVLETLSLDKGAERYLKLYGRLF